MEAVSKEFPPESTVTAERRQLDEVGPAEGKPVLRGVIHQVAFFVSLASGIALIIAAPTSGSKAVMVLYAASISCLFGTSALFHRHTWGPVGRRRMRRADHSMIFLAIAGSYTAVAGIALGGWSRTAVLCIVWVGALFGIALRQLWLDAPKWAIAIPYVTVGWAGLGRAAANLAGGRTNRVRLAAAGRPCVQRGGGRVRARSDRTPCQACSGTTRSSMLVPSSAQSFNVSRSPGSCSRSLDFTREL